MKPDPPVFNSSPLRIVMGYAWYGALWIIFSDLLVVQLVPTHLLATASIAKGWIFITSSDANWQKWRS